MIDKIPQARTSGRELNPQELSFLKEKLFAAEDNPNILRVARGEGRKKILDEIVVQDYVLFDWGMKGQHALYEPTPYRDFLEPGMVDIQYLKDLIERYRGALEYRYLKFFSDPQKHICTNRGLTDRLCTLVEQYKDSIDVLINIKDWICFALQTAGDRDFKNISPWVSASVGELRYKTAYCFGQGRTKVVSANDQKTINPRFVIFDTWVDPQEDGVAFKRTSQLIEEFDSIGLPWFKDLHHEIMLKYAIYPQRLVGYYYIENDNVQYYYVNPHYLNKWQENPEFEIGDYLYIDQGNVRFPASNPYRMIYGRYGSKFFVSDSR